MNRKEIKEIKKLFSYDDNPITRIRGFLVDDEKNILFENYEKYFLSMDQNELFKYLEIFKKSLSGKKNRNLIDLKIRDNAIRDDYLTNMIVDELKSLVEPEQLVEKIVENYVNPGRYYIILAYGAYDIPAKDKNQETLFDASEDVYEFILCSICPVSLDKPALGYDGKTIKERDREWYVGAPNTAFLYPAFNNRQPDTDAFLMYKRQPNEDQTKFIEKALKCASVQTPEKQRMMFEETLQLKEESFKYEEASKMFRQLGEQQYLAGLEGNDVIIPMTEFAKYIIQEKDERESAEEKIRDQNGDAAVSLQNLMNWKQILIETGGAIIATDALNIKEIELRKIDGRTYFMIPAGTTTVNGIPVQTDNTIGRQMKISDYQEIMPESEQEGEKND